MECVVYQSIQLGEVNDVVLRESTKCVVYQSIQLVGSLEDPFSYVQFISLQRNAVEFISATYDFSRSI